MTKGLNDCPSCYCCVTDFLCETSCPRQEYPGHKESCLRLFLSKNGKGVSRETEVGVSGHLMYRNSSAHVKYDSTCL